jgi:hypothetical protein
VREDITVGWKRVRPQREARRDVDRWTPSGG